MSKEIYISTTPHETRLAIVEDEQLAEIYYERENEYTLAGSIYNGKVTRVLPGMQSAFVDIGLERDAFLYVTDFMEEQGDSADFEAESGSRRPQGGGRDSHARDSQFSRDAEPSRDASEGRRGREPRERRGRADRAGREGTRSTEPVGDTEIFEEPIAPHPVEGSAFAGEADNMAALDAPGSRRWRGRRGRRRGRGLRPVDEPANAEVVTGTYAEHVEPELLHTETELPSLEASAEEPAKLDAHLDSGASEEASGRENSSRWASRDDRGRRGGRDRRGRDRDGRRGRDRGERAPRSDYGDAMAEDAAPEFVGEPIVLPGESIRKYRDPAEVAAEDALKAASAPKLTPIATAPSFEVTGWDGGPILPGENLSRFRNRKPASQPVSAPAPKAAADTAAAQSGEAVPGGGCTGDVAPAQAAPEAIAPPSSPEETGGLTLHPASAEAVSPIASDAPQDSPSETAAVSDYEPTEGESATLGDPGRRDYRRLENRPEDENPAQAENLPEALDPQADASGAPSEVSATGSEEVSSSEISDPGTADPAVEAGAPDAATYDLQAAEAPLLPSDNSPTATQAEFFSTAPGDRIEASHAFTALQPNGEMLSETSSGDGEAFQDLPPVQDTPDASPVRQEPAVQSVPLDEAETLPEPVLSGQPAGSGNSPSSALLPEVHAYGEGPLEEELLDGDEYEYEAMISPFEEEEFEEYEEETLDESADLGSVLEDLSMDEKTLPSDDMEAEEYAAECGAGGFTVEDFGGEPEEGEEASSESTGDNASGGDRRARRDGRRGNRDRRGFRNGSDRGGDRNRGRGRQSVQTMDLPAINDLLKPGQEILVQIAKEPIAKKGARITSHIALPGRFLVFMPTVNHTGVSRKISSDEERRRLKSILLSEKGDAQGGFIVRTAAEGAGEEELRNDLRFLIQLWQDIKARSESSKSPALIYHDLSLVERILRDQVTDNFSAIWVDSESEYESVLRFLQRFQPSLVRRVKLYTKETPLFEHFGVTQEIDKALKSKVWLKSGGSIVINQTEALVAIDINTGKYVGKTARLEDTILKTNLDAIPEIVRQIRLRDLGGIIVIDFIDMDERKNRAKVMQALEEELKSDRAPSKVLPFNDFGLVIMTRKRVKQSLERTLCIPDPVTEGTGMIKSPITVANEIYVEMRKMSRHLDKSDVMLRVHPEVVKQLKTNGGRRLQELEEMTHKTILVKSDPALNPEQFDIH